MTSLSRNTLINMVLIVTVYSCTDSSGNNNSPAPQTNSGQNGTGVNCVGTALSWQSGIGTIFQTNCGSCHSNYTSFSGVSGNIASIQSRIASGNMPQGRVLAAADKTSIQAWVAAGMPQVTAVATPNPNCGSQTAATPAPTLYPNQGYTYPTPYPTYYPNQPYPTPTPQLSSGISYAASVQPIMSTYCVSCHSSGGRSPALDTYTAVKSNYYSAISAIQSGSMPRGSGRVPQTQIAILQQWAAGQYAP